MITTIKILKNWSRVHKHQNIYYFPCHFISYCEKRAKTLFINLYSGCNIVYSHSPTNDTVSIFTQSLFSVMHQIGKRELDFTQTNWSTIRCIGIVGLVCFCRYAKGPIKYVLDCTALCTLLEAANIENKHPYFKIQAHP